MKTLRHHSWTALTTALLLVAAFCAQAGTETNDFRNQSSMNYGFLFADPSGDMTFTNLTFKNDFAGWTLEPLSASLAIYHGPAVVAPNAGRIRLTFDYVAPAVVLQWAEVMFDSGTMTYDTTASGSAMFDSSLNGAAQWAASNVFSGANGIIIDDYFNAMGASAVPLPSSVVLLLSAAAFLGFSRRSSLNPGHAG